MVFNLEFKKQSQKRGNWTTSIYADTKEEAVEKARKLIQERNLKNAKLFEIVYSKRTIYNFDKEIINGRKN